MKDGIEFITNSSKPSGGSSSTIIESTGSTSLKEEEEEVLGKNRRQVRAKKQAIRREQIVEANVNKEINSRLSKLSFSMVIGLGLMSVCYCEKI